MRISPLLLFQLSCKQMAREVQWTNVHLNYSHICNWLLYFNFVKNDNVLYWSLWVLQGLGFHWNWASLLCTYVGTYRNTWFSWILLDRHMYVVCTIHTCPVMPHGMVLHTVSSLVHLTSRCAFICMYIYEWTRVTRKQAQQTQWGFKSWAYWVMDKNLVN